VVFLNAANAEDLLVVSRPRHSHFVQRVDPHPA
jgi:hypothetical protein